MTTPAPVSMRRLLEASKLSFLGLEVVAGAGALDRNTVTNPRIQKPGLALAGYLPYVKPNRLQILGESEYAYLETLGEDEAQRRLLQLIYREIPGVISAKGLRPSQEVLRACDERGRPFMVTSQPTSDVIQSVSAYLEEALAPTVHLHGVLVDVFSLGTLIIGDPGIGKSECGLELVYRGHRLVADDIVVVRRSHREGLRGYPHEHLENFLELRGVGIIDVRKHFGMTAASPSVLISLVIRLVKLSKEAREEEQRWREQLMQTGQPWSSTLSILGVDVPMYTMPVAPGRHVSIMVETAVRKCILAQRGVHDERSFIEAVNRRAAGEQESDEG